MSVTYLGNIFMVCVIEKTPEITLKGRQMFVDSLITRPPSVCRTTEWRSAGRDSWPLQNFVSAVLL